jgi:Tol biopolymer transport system component
LKKLCLLSLLALALATLAGCQDQPQPLFIEVDRSRRAVTAEAPTVRDALAAAEITLGPLDRVKPDLYVETEPGMVIVVTRVEEQFETSRVVVPFGRKTVINEALPAGETRLIQLGANGEDEITYRITLEDGVEVERTQVSRVAVSQPVDEIVAVGAQQGLAPVPLEGSLAYLSAGNAWLMRDNSGARRPLTSEGDLDGRVFDLSPDGRWLLYSRRLEGDVETPINQLWMVDTTIVGEAPISLPVQSVLYAQWSPDGRQIAYSTAERTPSSPGWRANNDLWLVQSGAVFSERQRLAGGGVFTGAGETPLQASRVISPGTTGAYGWWGTTFRWSPDGRRLAYARPDQIGVVQLISPTVITVLADFIAYETYSEWVWVPSLSWSPDSRFLAAVLHPPLLPAGPAPAAPEPAAPQDDPAFDLWLFDAEGPVKARVAEQVGMWATPAWGTAGIVYGQAVNPLRSVDSRYALYLRDRDGSNPRRLFPVAEEPGVEAPVQVVWSLNGQKFIVVYNGNLYLAEVGSGAPRQLTANNQNSQPRWTAGTGGRQPTPESASTPAITSTTSITASNVVTPTDSIR